MQTFSLTPKRLKQGSEEIQNAENADTKTQKMRLTGFDVTGFGEPPCACQGLRSASLHAGSWTTEQMGIKNKIKSCDLSIKMQLVLRQRM